MARKRKRKDDDWAGAWLLFVCFVCLWVFFKFGWQWLVAVIAAVAAVVAWAHWYSRKNEQARFDTLVMIMMKSKPDPISESKLNASLWKAGQYDRAEVFRNVQILRDSIYHALNSKKLDTARNNYEGMLKTWESIREKKSILGSSTYAELGVMVQDAERQFHTVVYVNHALGLKEKSTTLKTPKARVKYLQQAAEVLKIGIDEGKGDMQVLQSQLAMVEVLQNQ